MAKILVIHGPNLNLLGEREPEVYGRLGLAEIDRGLAEAARERGHQLETYQSNAEHELVQRVQGARGAGVEFIIINPGAFTHTSIALRDAFLAVEVPFIEVHLSNVYRRESFRHRSYLSDIAEGVVIGLGPQGYRLALQAAATHLGPGG